MQAVHLLTVMVATGVAYAFLGQPPQGDSVPAGLVRELVSYRLPAYPNELREQAIAVDVSLTILVDTRGRVNLLRREAVTPRVPSEVLSDNAVALLFEQAEESVASWKYSPGPIATKYRVVLGVSAPDAPDEAHPPRLIYVEPFVPRALLSHERRVLVRGYLRADGTLADLSTEGAGALEAVVLSAARQWRFGGRLRSPMFATLAAIRIDEK